LTLPSPARWPIPAQLAFLLLLSLLFEMLLQALKLPAALMLGPMVAAILLAGLGTRISMPRPVFTFGQGIIGCLIASGLTLAILPSLLQQWPVLLLSSFSVIGASLGLGWMLTRLGILPGSTAIWGSAPGAAAVMVVMSEGFGGDIRLVALMQYLRVVLVSSAAVLVAWFYLGHGAASAPPRWFPAPGWGLAGTLALAGLGMASGRLRALKGGPVLVPMILGAVLNDAGLLRIDLPPWLLAAAYACVGWSVGLRFNRPILAYAAAALPRMVGSVLALILLCGLLAVLLEETLHVGPLTAYLAASPGGVDAVAIIANSASHVNLGFVMAMQMTRFVIVLIIVPTLARWVAQRSGAGGDR
jgi:membrane AbrB-like protein